MSEPFEVVMVDGQPTSSPLRFSKEGQETDKRSMTGIKHRHAAAAVFHTLPYARENTGGFGVPKCRRLTRSEEASYLVTVDLG